MRLARVCLVQFVRATEPLPYRGQCSSRHHIDSQVAMAGVLRLYMVHSVVEVVLELQRHRAPHM